MGGITSPSPTLADEAAGTDDIAAMKLSLLTSLSLLPYAIAITVDPTSTGNYPGFLSCS
jgi:hypothetical protein